MSASLIVLPRINLGVDMDMLARISMANDELHDAVSNAFISWTDRHCAVSVIGQESSP